MQEESEDRHDQGEREEQTQTQVVHEEHHEPVISRPVDMEQRTIEEDNGSGCETCDKDDGAEQEQQEQTDQHGQQANSMTDTSDETKDINFEDKKLILGKTKAALDADEYISVLTARGAWSWIP